MANAWFDTTVKPLIEGHSITQGQGFISSQYTTGRTRNRRIYSTAPFSATVYFLCTDAQARLFESWFKSDLGAGDGGLVFQMPVGTPTGRSDSYECKATNIYTIEVNGPRRFKISMSVELTQSPQFAGEYYSYYPDLILYADVFDLTVNQELPE